MRTQRSEKYGHLTCGSCTERQRDEFHCVIKGHERPPALAPKFRVEMGTARTVLTKSCPVGLALQSERTAMYLTAYGLVSRWNKWPPGRECPRTVDAIATIQREHDLIDNERTKAA